MLNCQAELMSYGDASLDRKAGQRGSLLLRLVTLYYTDFQEAIQGSTRSLHSLPTDELVGGARLSHIFTASYGGTVSAMDAAQDLSLEQVRTAIRNSSVPFWSPFLTPSRDRVRQYLFPKVPLKC